MKILKLSFSKQCKTQKIFVESCGSLNGKELPSAKVRTSHNAAAGLQSASEMNDELLKHLVVFF